jgi:superfamily II DNA or RNA helicase
MCWWLRVDPVQQASDDRLLRVVRWEDWPERPNIDLGIDLVGWDRLGRLWAVQCKAYQPENLVSKSEVAQLVAEATLKPRGPFQGRIFITSSDGYTENAKTLAKKNRVLLLDRSHLEAGFHSGSGALRWPSSAAALRTLLRGKAVVRKPAKARPHQKRAVQATLTELARSPRGQLLMACGTGKTLTALWIKERLIETRKAKQGQARVVVLLPSISLLAQTLREWAANRNTEWAALAVCSDTTTNSSRDESYDDMEAVSAGFPVTTERASIREFLQSVEKEQIIFSTYQSSAEVAAAARAAKIEFDLVICDEAHRLAGQAGKSYASVLDEKTFPAHKRLFMTATPKRFVASAKKKAADEGYVVASMDDPSKFGEVAHQLPFGEAIKKSLLTDYQVVIAVTTDTKARELLEENRFVGLDGRAMTASDLAAAIAVAKAAKRHKITRSISFHSTIKRSKQFVDTLQKLCAEKLPGLPRVLDADHVDGSVSAKERQRRIDRLKAGATGFNLLANARCLTEGVDVPALDGVAFVDPRQSEVDIVQAVGRAIRLSPNKELGTIIVPVVCSAEEAAAGKLDAAGHKKLRQVLWALRAHDTNLAVEIDDFVFAQALSAGGTRNSGLPEKVKIEFDGDDLKDFAAKIRTSVLKIGSPDAEWVERYAAVVSFHQEHKRWPMGGSKNPDEKTLGLWITTQRTMRRRLDEGKPTKIDQGRVDVLSATPGWQWDPLEDQWMGQYKASCEFFNEFGRWPSTTGASVAERDLGRWITTQRTNGARRRGNKRSDLSQERYIVLSTTDGWSWDPQAEAWSLNYEAALRYFAREQRWPRKGATEPRERALGKWVVRVRGNGNSILAGAEPGTRGCGYLTSQQFTTLQETPGWSWDPISDEWRTQYTCAVTYFENNGHWPKTSDSNPEIRKLGRWVATNRKQGRRYFAGAPSDMTAERFAQLESTAGWSWNPLTDEWQQSLEAVADFHNIYNRCPAFGAQGSEGRLASWVGSQRHAWSMGSLSPERAAVLEGLPGWSWNRSQDRWDETLETLRLFFVQQGRRPRFGSKGAEGRLAAWMGSQWQARNSGRLSPERVKRLESIPGWVWSAKG